MEIFRYFPLLESMTLRSMKLANFEKTKEKHITFLLNALNSSSVIGRRWLFIQRNGITRDYFFCVLQSYIGQKIYKGQQLILCDSYWNLFLLRNVRQL